MGSLNIRPSSVCLMLLLGIICTSTGCVRGYTQKMARFEFGDAPVRDVIRTTGVYKVKWTYNSSKNLHGIDETSVLLREGTLVGFHPMEDGRLLAFAGDEQFVVDSIPDGAKYCVWFNKQDRETQFGREVRKAVAAAGQTALVVGLVGGIVAVDMATDDDCDQDRWLFYDPRHK